MPTPDEKLLKYFMDQTNKRLDDLSGEFKKDMLSLHSRFDALNEFKIRMLVNSRWVSMIVSGLASVLTLAISIGSSVYLNRLERESLAASVKETIQLEKNPHETPRSPR